MEGMAIGDSICIELETKRTQKRLETTRTHTHTHQQTNEKTNKPAPGGSRVCGGGGGRRHGQGPEGNGEKPWEGHGLGGVVDHPQPCVGRGCGSTQHSEVGNQRGTGPVRDHNSLWGSKKKVQEKAKE